MKLDLTREEAGWLLSVMMVFADKRLEPKAHELRMGIGLRLDYLLRAVARDPRSEDEPR